MYCSLYSPDTVLCIVYILTVRQPVSTQQRLYSALAIKSCFIYFQKTCEIGMHGQNCTLKCNCENGGTCLPSNGTCICDDGFHGILCELRNCPENRFGPGCMETCQCTPNNTKRFAINL